MSSEKADKPKKEISRNRAWGYVLLGGAFEIVWAAGLKYEEVPPLLVIIAIIASFDLIIRATQLLPVGTTYAVFTGIGTIGTVVVEAFVSAGQISFIKVALVLLLLLCIIGLKLSTGKEGH